MPSNKPGYAAEYIKKHYRENKQYYRDKADERRRKISVAIREYKRAIGCSRCSETEPVCLDFHHTDPSKKSDTISRMIQRGLALEKIFVEIAKCILLCANYHRKETHKDLVV